MSNTEILPDDPKVQTFLKRMLPDLMQGKSFEESGKEVLNRDVELATFSTNKSEAQQMLVDLMAKQVYDAIKSMKK